MALFVRFARAGIYDICFPIVQSYMFSLPPHVWLKLMDLSFTKSKMLLNKKRYSVHILQAISIFMVSLDRLIAMLVPVKYFVFGPSYRLVALVYGRYCTFM